MRATFWVSARGLSSLGRNSNGCNTLHVLQYHVISMLSPHCMECNSHWWKRKGKTSFVGYCSRDNASNCNLNLHTPKSFRQTAISLATSIASESNCANLRLDWPVLWNAWRQPGGPLESPGAASETSRWNAISQPACYVTANQSAVSQTWLATLKERMCVVPHSWCGLCNSRVTSQPR